MIGGVIYDTLTQVTSYLSPLSARLFSCGGRGTNVVSGWQNKLQSAIANVTPAGMLAEQHRKMAAPGSAKTVSAEKTE
jgi:hypothetical protein